MAAITLNQSAQPVEADIVLYQGDYFEVDLIFKDKNNDRIDLTGFSAKAQVKDETATVALFSATVNEGLYHITDNPKGGAVTMFLPSADSDLIAPGSYRWDFELSDNSTPVKKRTYFVGSVTVTGDISE